MEPKKDFSKQIKVYEDALVSAKNNGLDRSKAKDAAKAKLYAIFPDLNSPTTMADNNQFWSETSRLVDLHFERPVKRSRMQPKTNRIEPTQDMPQSRKPVIYSDLMRFIADRTGYFLPNRVGLAIGEFFGFDPNIQNVTKQNLKREGYIFEKTTIEIFTCRKPDPHQQEIARLEKLAKDLIEQAREVTQKITALKK